MLISMQDRNAGAAVPFWSQSGAPGTIGGVSRVQRRGPSRLKMTLKSSGFTPTVLPTS